LASEIGSYRASSELLPEAIKKINRASNERIPDAIPDAVPDAIPNQAAVEASVIFLTKENGEMCRVSFFHFESKPYVVVGSKNVILTCCVASEPIANADLATEAYQDKRFTYVVEMSRVLLAQYFSLTDGQREDILIFTCRDGQDWVTLNGESISPIHQHVQNYTNEKGERIPAEIRFFAITNLSSFWSNGLTVEDPVVSRSETSILTLCFHPLLLLLQG